MAATDAAILETHAPPAERQATVLLAEIRSPAGPAAGTPSTGGALARCQEVLRQAAELSGGRVLHDRNQAVLALFSTPDAAAAAAARMHAYTETIPPTPEKPAVGIAFHSGPVGQRDHDIFGDTVNLALQLAGEAANGQILTSQDTASSLSPSIQDAVRPLKGKDGGLLKGELVWRDSTRQIVSVHARAAHSRAALRLTCDGKTVLRRREGDSISLGRDPGCDLALEGAAVSRKHCTIVRRDAVFYLRDHSTNGTFVALAGKDEVCVKGSEMALVRSGRIALGQPTEKSLHVVVFASE